MTYSIVACDLEAREWGVAVQSKFLAVGAAVPFAVGRGRRDRDAGARERRLRARRPRAAARGPLARARSSPQLTRADDGRDDRQLGIVDAHGGSATFTGTACIDWAGGIAGHCSRRRATSSSRARPSMRSRRTFLASPGAPLAERLLACLARGTGGRRRSPRPAVGVAARRPRGRRLRRRQRSADRPPRRRPSSPDRRARAHVRDPPHAVRRRRRVRSGSRSTTRSTRDRRPARRARLRPGARCSRRSSRGPTPRTSRSASTASTRSIPSCSPRCAGGGRADSSYVRHTFVLHTSPRVSAGPQRREPQAIEGRAAPWDEGNGSGTIAVATTCALIGAAGGIATSGAASTAKTSSKTAKTTTSAAGRRTRPGRPGGPLRVGAAEQGRDGVHHGDARPGNRDGGLGE